MIEKPRHSNNGVRGFILCGGLGTRLRSVLDDRPKSMALVAGVPFLQLLLQQLQVERVSTVILGTGHKAEQIEHFFGSGESLGMDIRYSHESEQLGTGGAVKLAEDKLTNPALILNGDSYVEWRLQTMLHLFAFHRADLVMVVQTVPDISRYGSVVLENDGRIAEFVEKGSRSGPGLINAGVYLLRKEILSGLSLKTFISLEKDIFPDLLDSGRAYGIVTDGIFIDIGVPQDLERAQTLLSGKAYS